MQSLYGSGLAYIQASAFGGLAQSAAPEIVRLLTSASIPVRRVVDLGCGAGGLAAALLDAGFDVTAVDRSPALLAFAATFRQVDGVYRRSREVHRVGLFDTAELMRALEAAGFTTRTAQACGTCRLAPRRRAFLCVRV